MILEIYEYNGKEFPVRSVYLMSVLRKEQAEWAKFADYELSEAIRKDLDDDVREAIDIDNEIYHYFDSGFIASNPTDDEIIKRLKQVYYG